MVEQELRALDAAVHFQAEPNLPSVKGDVVQIQQVVINLLLNAAQAMAAQETPKEITVSLKNDSTTHLKVFGARLYREFPLPRDD